MKGCISAAIHLMWEECILIKARIAYWQGQRTGVAAAFVDVGDVLLIPGVSVMAAWSRWKTRAFTASALPQVSHKPWQSSN